MSRDSEIADVGLGIVLRVRPLARRSRFLKVGTKADGAREIRAAFTALSSYVHVQLVNEMRDVPRPFAVLFHDDMP